MTFGPTMRFNCLPPPRPYSSARPRPVPSATASARPAVLSSSSPAMVRGERLQALVAAYAEMTRPLHLGGRMNFNVKPNGSINWIITTYRPKPTSFALNFMHLPRCTGLGTSA
jgi:hypothetical protein